MTTTTLAIPETDTARLSVLLEEYRALKAEQVHRIGVRDQLVYALLVVIAAVAGGTPFAGRAVPLLLPPVCVLLGWVFLRTDHMITSIGRYLRDDLTPLLTTVAGPGLLAWENGYHCGDLRSRQRKHLQLGIDLATFCLPAAAAIAVFWTTSTSTHPALIAVSLAEAAATAVLAWQITVYAEIPTTRNGGRA